VAPPSTVPAFVPDDDTPLFVISVAAELAGMHAQTLRQYDRLGLVTPSRTRGGGRRYSPRDVAVLRDVQRLSQEEGVSLAGIARILRLQDEVSMLREQVGRLSAELDELRAVARGGGRVFAVSPSGDVLPGRLGERPRSLRSQAIVVWRPQEREARRG
jgi:MerR family transcriptional regulator/heat shock protein HspR